MQSSLRRHDLCTCLVRSKRVVLFCVDSHIRQSDMRPTDCERPNTDMEWITSSNRLTCLKFDCVRLDTNVVWRTRDGGLDVDDDICVVSAWKCSACKKVPGKQAYMKGICLSLCLCAGKYVDSAGAHGQRACKG